MKCQITLSNRYTRWGLLLGFSFKQKSMRLLLWISLSNMNQETGTPAGVTSANAFEMKARHMGLRLGLGLVCKSKLCPGMWNSIAMWSKSSVALDLQNREIYLVSSTATSVIYLDSCVTKSKKKGGFAK